MELKKLFEAFLYKNKLNEQSLIDIINQLSTSTMENIMNDFKVDQKRIIYAFSDGNCRGNGTKKAQGGYSVYFADTEFSQFNKTRLVTNDPTNNKVELSGINTIVKTIRENTEMFRKNEVIVYTDSQYSIKCVTLWYKSWLKNNWKNSKGEPVKNKELIENIIRLIEENTEAGCHIKFKHVFGHTKEPNNKSSFEYFLWLGNNIVDTNINKLLEKAKELKKV